MKSVHIYAESLKNNITIEKATMKDVDDVKKLYYILESMHLEHNISVMSWLKRMLKNLPVIRVRGNINDNDRNMFATMILHSDMNLFILKDSGVVKGLLNLRYIVEDHTCMISAIVTNEQGKGYGKLLLNYAIERAKENRCTNVRLKVWDFNDHAFEFYMRNGFKPLKAEDNFYLLEYRLD